MIRTPPSQLNQNVEKGADNQDKVPENESVVSDVSKKGTSRSSITDSQIKLLDLEEENEEAELRASIEQDRIVAEQKLAELQIQHNLALKTEQRKAAFLKRQRERNLKKVELLSRSSTSSRSSAYTNASKRVEELVAEAEKVRPHNEYEESSETEVRNTSTPGVKNATAPEPGVNEILSQAFKALQSRNMKDLPSFSGDVMEWTIFESEFKTSTEEYKLTDRDNLRRLNKALQGKARKTVESLLASPENVQQIIRMSQSNFGRTEWVVANRLEALRNLEIVKEGNIESFRAFYNAVIGTKVAMTNAKADNYLMNPELISHLADKLPAFSKQMWVRHKAALMKEGVIIEFNTFSRWLEDEMDNQLASLNPVFSAKKASYQLKPKPMVLNVNCRDDEGTKICPLCSANSHVGLDKCKQFHKLSVAQRRSAANSCKVCYICLKSDHSRRNCKSEKKCSICKKNHHELVHSDDSARNSKYTRTNTYNSQQNVCNVHGKNMYTLLRIGKVRIQGPRGTSELFALFDEGSSLSMMDAAVAENIGLRGPIAPVSYRWTNGILHKEEQSMMLSFRISGPSDQAKWFNVSNIQTVQNIALPPVKFDVAKRLYPMLDDDKLVAIQDACPCILIGSNNAGLVVPLKTVQYSLQGLQLTRCHLGWTIHGVIDPTIAGSNKHAFLCSENDDIELTDLVKKMYKVENFGISGQMAKIADEDQRALDIMNRTIKRRGGTIRGYARKLEPEEIAETSNTWYLPHFSVVSSEKFRLVMDAKAKSHGFSLNDLLLKGPDLVPPLIAILIRARMKRIAFVADIKEMFHQVLIRREDQDSQRFLWRGMNRMDPPSVYLMMLMIFGAVSSPSMAQFIKNFNAKELEEKYPGVE
ncbi:uncharacterized protein LOC131687167 [Topomyia yanbarensis]|uniref:uncharacterized protein LOC131687167 n=1 Tax=Topomyia yanbarensis TaxID=2498891 RepID=UPI00273A9558|nr:uncharacterized protein LOC131687167 [Topomyia yanbarensis]